MVTTELTPIRQTWAPTLSAGAVIGLTAFGIGAAVVDPALAGSTQPHPTLTGTLAEAAGILQNNARVLSVPFLLVALGFPKSRLGRGAGDLVVAGLTVASVVPVGLELGRWQGRLLPYLPQLPLEWAALVLAVYTWIIARSGHMTVRQLAPLATVVLALLTCSACLETWATPHRQGNRLDEARDIRRAESGWMPITRILHRPRPDASRSQAPFPSLRSVPLGRLAGAAGISSTTRPPQGGIT